LYSGVDAADKINCRLDFAVVLYPGHLWIYKERFELNPNIPIRRQTPPTFLLHAENDPVENAGVPKRCTNTRTGAPLWAASHEFPITRSPQSGANVDRDNWGDSRGGLALTSIRVVVRSAPQVRLISDDANRKGR
jgi:hypothetical protein